MFNILLFILTISLSMSSSGYITDEHPNSRYTVHGNGTVTDNITGLMWKRCSQGQTWESNTCTGGAMAYNWQEALEQAAGDNFVYDDWRLPNIKQLASIIAYNRYNPSINNSIFKNTPSEIFWSASPVVANSSNALRLNFYYGGTSSSRSDSIGSNSSSRTDSYRVRLVRVVE